MTLRVVIGPPAAGKSTYIREHMKPGDIRIDFDLLANTLAGLEPANHEHTSAVKKVTKAARDAAITAAMKHADAVDVWLIHSTPAQSTLDRYQREGADIITVDPGKATVMHRIKHERPKHMHAVAARWYAQHDETTNAKPSKANSKTTTERGYGQRHQTIRRRLLAQLTDGTPCPWCGKPMYRDKAKNFDKAPLEADHTKDLKHHGPGDADRLLHRRCNRQRCDGQDTRSPLNHTQDSTPTAPRGFTWG